MSAELFRELPWNLLAQHLPTAPRNQAATGLYVWLMAISQHSSRVHSSDTLAAPSYALKIIDRCCVIAHMTNQLLSRFVVYWRNPSSMDAL